MSITMLKPMQDAAAETSGRKLKFKGKRPATLNLEAAKKEIGIGDGAEYRLTPASPSWARKSFNETGEKRNHSNGLQIDTSQGHGRLQFPVSPRLSVMTASSAITCGRAPFDFEKRLREDYRRCYV
jgi:hypothetical protein